VLRLKVEEENNDYRIINVKVEKNNSVKYSILITAKNGKTRI
jgi:hypothetical protein